MTSDVELLPCPFCGSENIDPKGWASTNSAGPACDDCGAGAGAVRGTLLDNAEAWNRRAVQPPGDVVAWLIEWRDAGAADLASSKRRSVHLHNAIGDYRTLDPDATVTPLYATGEGEA